MEARRLASMRDVQAAPKISIVTARWPATPRNRTGLSRADYKRCLGRLLRLPGDDSAISRQGELEVGQIEKKI